MYKKVLATVLAAMVTFGSFAASDTQAATREEISQIKISRSANFKYWEKNSAIKAELVNYIKDITNKRSQNFIPVEDRIAVFDMDGTFLCETAPYYLDHMLFLERALHDENYTANASDRAFAQDLENWLRDKSSADNLGSSAPHQSSVFAGMTFPEYADYVNNFIKTPVQGLSNLRWGEAFYLPMVEVIKYLQANDFKVYVVTGSERELVRLLVCDLLDLPENQIIGTDIAVLASDQGDKDGLDYTFTADDYIVRGQFVIKNLKMNKVSAIVREIGKQPVLAFGNSSGDAAMLNYTAHNNRHKSMSFMILCDDLNRELGNSYKAESAKQLAERSGWHTISMRDDWKTIYGENVQRTN